MSIKSYKLEQAPIPKDPKRHKLSLAGAEKDVKKLVSKLSNIGGRPFRASDKSYDWSVYIYDLKEKSRDKLKSELDKVIGGASSKSIPEEGSGESSGSSVLSKKYTFDSFVIGANTRFTYAACKAVAENPGKSYNPLFIYGGVGLGKTHLMQAIGNHVIENFPEYNVISENMQVFINSVIEAIEKNTLNELRNKYKKTDLLLIDDIQFLEQSDATQEEFFHIFNAMHEVGKQIVMTSDKPPKQLTTLEDRLKSRFEWGLTTDVKSPNFDTRKAILKRKANQAGLELSDDIYNYIAERLTSNIRELEGILNRIGAYKELSREPITLELVKDIIKNIISSGDEEEKEEKEVSGEVGGETRENPPAPSQPPSASPPPPPQYQPVVQPQPPPHPASAPGCGRCSGPLNFIHQYQRWYCPRCGVYTEPMPQYAPQYHAPPQQQTPPPPPQQQAPPPPPQQQEPPPPPQQQTPPQAPPDTSDSKQKCDKCGAHARYIEKYSRFYCDRCGEYLADKEPEDIPPPPTSGKPASSVSAPQKPDRDADAGDGVAFESMVIGQEDAGLREIKAGYFVPEGCDEIFGSTVDKLRKLAEQKKFNFFISPLFTHRYTPDQGLNFEKLAKIAADNSADIAIAMVPPEDSALTGSAFTEKFGDFMQKAEVPCEILSRNKIRESDALNLMLDIAICARK